MAHNDQKPDRSVSIKNAVTGRMVVIGDAIVAGVDMADAQQQGEIKNALVVQFDCVEDMRKAMRNGIKRLTF